MKIIGKILLFVTLFFIFTQLMFTYIFPSRYVYNQRINYDVFKDNIYTIEASIKQIKKTISNEKLNKYYIFLGDSVGYGTPCPPDQTISSYMNSISKNNKQDLRVFNLAIPSTMFGDYYVILLLLNKYGISTDNLIINFSYWEINAKNPTFWFKSYLKELDKESYDKMIEAGAIQEDSLWKNLKLEIYHFLNKNVYAFGYAGFTSNKVQTLANRILHQSGPAIAAWSTKPELASTMRKPENRWYFSDVKYNLSETGNEIYFINKITELQKGKNTIFILNALNKELLPVEMAKPGFINNMKAINEYFTDRNLNFIDYNNKVEYSLFSDHVHLLPQGYKFVAQDLLNRINNKEDS